mmetsp:Transcript_114211/g.329912  ORF Transcript_114211/g.329912 Transcript_114211/m.329912 type:complete len:204 (+) Transcript_114211:211-822(+)
MLGVHHRRLVSADAEEAVVEFVDVVDHISDGHEVLVADRLLGDALPPQEVLRQEGCGHGASPEGLPEGIGAVRAGEAARDAHHRDAVSRGQSAPGRAAAMNLGAWLGGGGDLLLQELEEGSQCRVGVDVQHRHGHAVAVRELRGDLSRELRVAAQVEEVLVEVQRLEVQVQRLGPHGLHNRRDPPPLLAVRSGPGCNNGRGRI